MGNHVHHMGITLDHPLPGHAHRSIAADAFQIADSQIDQHFVFGPLLFIPEELRCEPLILISGSSAGSGSRDRPRLHPPAGHADQQFR